MKIKNSPLNLARGLKCPMYLIALALLFTSVNLANAQQSKIKIKGIKVKKKNVNFSANGTLIQHLTLEDNTASPQDLETKKTYTFSLIDNYANINFRWKNPLKYKFTWKDSVYNDEQQQALKDFLKLLNPLFNIPTETSSANKSSVESAAKKASADTVPIAIPSGGFKDYDLTLLYTQIILNQSKLTVEERGAINKFTPKLKALEDSDVDRIVDAKKTFTELFNVDDPNEIHKSTKDGIADIATTNINGWKTTLSKNSDQNKIVSDATKDIAIKDELVSSLFQTGIAKYIEKSKTLNASNVNLLKKLEGIVDVLVKSAEGDFKPFVFGQYNDVSRTRKIRLEDGKVLQTELVIDQYKVADDGLSVTKDKEVQNVKLIFRSYDPVTFSVSTGLFYGSTSLVGFGTATKNNEMVVTQDTIKKNTAVTALFGNISFGIGSKILAPTIQLGVDPTKKHPFFLLGGGIAFPVASFALTAGGIWTFEPTLNKLIKGDKISSTTELEKDIKNNFQLNPKGWYLGIQYNF
jgi:hypothetical protein